MIHPLIHNGSVKEEGEFGPRMCPSIVLLALMANRKNSLKQNTTRLQNKNALIEEEEHGYVQILIKKDHLEELQSILTIHR